MPKCTKVAPTTPSNRKTPTAMAPTMMTFNIMFDANQIFLGGGALLSLVIPTESTTRNRIHHPLHSPA